MVWLMAYLAQHAVQIALIGSVAATVYSVEGVFFLTIKALTPDYRFTRPCAPNDGLKPSSESSASNNS